MHKLIIAISLTVATSAQAQQGNFPGNPNLTIPGMGCNAYCEQERIDRQRLNQPTYQPYPTVVPQGPSPYNSPYGSNGSSSYDPYGTRRNPYSPYGN